MTIEDDDPQAVAEALDADKLGDGDDYDGDDPGVGFPPERPLGSGRETLTPTDEAFGESVAERDRRTTPDPLATELDAAARGEALDADAIEGVAGPAGEADTPGAQVGQLVDGHPVDQSGGAPVPEHDDGELLADDRPVAADRSAEEAAVHVESVDGGGSDRR
jgi:hypothetical protein